MPLVEIKKVPTKQDSTVEQRGSEIYLNQIVTNIVHAEEENKSENLYNQIQIEMPVQETPPDNFEENINHIFNMI